MKRLIREYFRLRRAELPEAFDLVVVAKRGAAALAFEEVARELDAALAACRRGSQSPP
ncbi:MAG: hypothetical protein Kow0092_13160 [Deferrisomatales bacterium]